MFFQHPYNLTFGMDDFTDNGALSDAFSYNVHMDPFTE